MNNSVKIIGGFLIGAAVGAVAGILLAPDSGENTRSKLKDETKRLADQLSESISHSLGLIKQEANKKMQEGKATYNNIKETASTNV